jgi:hypothetical protein
LQGANNRQALFIQGIADICIARPGGATLLARAEGAFQASYMLVILKYYNDGVTDDVFNNI